MIVPGRAEIPLHCYIRERSRYDGSWGVGKVREYGVYDAAGNMRFILRRGAYTRSPWKLYYPNPDGTEGERAVTLPRIKTFVATKNWVIRYMARDILPTGE